MRSHASICIAILGPTSSGKSRFAVELALKISGEIISLDSTAVYRGMNVGTDKPASELRQKVTHHLLDLLEPNEPFSAFHFVERADEAIDLIISRKNVPIIVGGTYFYLRALQNGMYPTTFVSAETIEEIEHEFLEEDFIDTSRMHAELKRLDPESSEKIHPNDRYRLVRALAIVRSTGVRPSSLIPVPLSEKKNIIWMKYGMTASRHQLTQNIVLRTESMLKNGLVEETRALTQKHPQARALQAIGYQEAKLFLDLKLTEKQLKNEIIEKTRQLAKRQLCWLRSDPEIRFIDLRDHDQVEKEFRNLKSTLESDGST